MKRLTHGLLFISCALMPTGSYSQDLKHAALDSSYGTYGETGLPFFGQTVDTRDLGSEWPADNLAPRGIVLHLDHGLYACFDPDLLRIALIWKESGPGNFLTMNGMAPGSYRQPHRKSPSGQKALPTPIGTPLFSASLAPGVQSGDSIAGDDPRSRSIDVEESGLGPLPPTEARWRGLRLDREGPTLLYQVGETDIEERMGTSLEKGELVVTRRIQIAPHKTPITFRAGSDSTTVPVTDSLQTLEIRYHCATRSCSSAMVEAERFDASPPSRIWNDPLDQETTSSGPILKQNGLAVDDIPLPLPNPWKRNVRPSDFDFFPDGRFAMVTFDGDVWIANQVDGLGRPIRWTRFASGLHEPMGLRVEDERIIIFDRNGLIRLVDRDQNGEADVYECLSDLAAQTAETREFAMGFELKPKGGYYLAKGGQVGTTRGKHNGTVLEVSPDGQELKVIATGLRQPFLGLDPKTGRLTASDQQGHWVPATPIQIIQPGNYYGFQPTFLGPKANHGKHITEPPLWIPHFVNQSGAKQVWLRDSRMGSLNDSLIHVGYNRPALFKIFLNGNDQQAAVIPLLEGFPTGLLSGRINPKDGLLYVGGFNLWGTVGKEIQGLYRIRPTDEPSWIPRAIQAFDEGLLLSFNQVLEPSLVSNFSNYTLDRWNYKRTNKYGSGHYDLKGDPGQEPLSLSSIYLSKDGRSVFLGIPGMKPVHTLRATYRPSTDEISSIYLTAHQLEPVDLPALGFEESRVDLSARKSAGESGHPKPTAARGKEIASTYGCIACHSVDGSQKVAEEPSLVVGPPWKGLFGSKREFTDGTSIPQADPVYLRESIIDPSRRITKGFDAGKTGVGMASYLGVLRDDQIDSLILYIRSLE